MSTPPKAPEPRIYFPVGKPITAEQLSRYSVEQLQNRQLFDPQFTGFEKKGFDWHNYVKLEILDPQLRAKTEKF